MNLNELELPAFVIAKFYRDSLVDPGEKVAMTPLVSEPQAQDNKAGIKPAESLGNNRQHILIIVEHKDVKHILGHELELLTGILTACKLGMDDIALLNRNNSPGHTYKDYNKQYKSRIVLLFEATPVSIGLPIDFPHFQPQSFNGTTYLFSPSLNELGNDKILKSKLWICLKKIFSL